MASQFDPSDFVDSDYQSAKSSYAGTATHPAAPLAPAGLHRPPTREELDVKVGETQQRLEDLRRAQEQLQRERASLEEARRRQTEFHTGREEILQHLARGVGLLEEAEFTARREVEQMARSLAELRDHLSKVEAIHEAGWTQENWNAELTRALVAIETARNEWNSARLRWPLLNGALITTDDAKPKVDALLGERSFGDLCRIGFALNWPVAAMGLIVILVLLFRH